MIHFCLLLCMLFGKAATSLSWMSTTPFQAPFLETVFSLLRCLKTLIWKSFVDKCKHSFRLSSRFPWLAILSVSQNHTFAVALFFCFVFCFGQILLQSRRLVNSLCSHEWPWISDPCMSPRDLGSQVCVTAPDLWDAGGWSPEFCVCYAVTLLSEWHLSLSSHQKHTSATLRLERLYPPVLLVFSNVVLAIWDPLILYVSRMDFSISAKKNMEFW